MNISATSRLILSKNVYFYSLITGLWLLAQIAFGKMLPDYTDLEAGKYFNAAMVLVNDGALPNLRYVFYGFITLFFALHIKFGIAFYVFIAFQVLLSFFAFLVFIHTIKKCYGVLPAFFCALLMSASHDWNSWNYYMFSDSTFFSFTLIWLASLLRYSKPNFKQILLQILFLSLCILSRPIGLGYLVLYGVFLIQSPIFTKKSTKLAIFAFSSILFLWFSYLVVERIEDHSLYISTTEGWIICGVPSDLAAQINVPEHYSPARAWIYLILQEPITFVKLFFLRLFSFFSPYSSYYSLSHNFLNTLVALGIYLGLFVRWRKKGLKRTNLDVALESFLFLYVFIIALQCDNWEGRFFAASIPLWLLIGVARIFKS